MMQSKELLNLADMIQGEVNRICVTDDITELYRLAVHVENNIHKLCSMRYKDFEKSEKEKPKKKLTFSERTKIAREFSEWCDLNHVKYRPESFLAYLCIKGYIDG